MPTYKLLIQYDGGRYAGWQIQPGLPTIQGELLDRLRRICDDPGLSLAGAARTDSGTHALGQVGTFRSEREWEPRRLRYAINGLLPPDIAVASAEVAPEGFHARRSATGRTYQYRISCSAILSPFVARYAHHHRGPLDLAAMREGALVLTGEHDFSSFKASADVSATPVKTISRCEVVLDAEIVSITVEGSSFLQHMVRTIAGTLLEVGRGRWHPRKVGEILLARQRAAAGPTLPARGLFLMSVTYVSPSRGSLPAGENG